MIDRRALSYCLTFAFSMAMLIGVTGCGGQSADSQASKSGPASPAAVATSTSLSNNLAASGSAPSVPATDVVSQFLDLVRRGGADSGAMALLTSKAQSELKRIGRTVQPIGSPDARFEVTRAEAMPGTEDAALVHSIWSEPQSDGQNSGSPDEGSQVAASPTLQYQVVWAVQREAGQWRISGLAMATDPDQDPMVINFEDGGRMAALLAETESDGTEASQKSTSSGDAKASVSEPASTQAAAANPAMAR